LSISDYETNDRNIDNKCQETVEVYCKYLLILSPSLRVQTMGNL